MYRLRRRSWLRRGRGSEGRGGGRTLAPWRSHGSSSICTSLLLVLIVKGPTKMLPIFAIVKIIKPSKQLLIICRKCMLSICVSVTGGGRSLRLITMNCDHITVNCNTQSITPPPPRPAPPAAVHVYCRLQRCTGHRSLATGPNTLVLCRGGDDRNHGEVRNHRGSSPILVATIVALSQVRLQTNLCQV